MLRLLLLMLLIGIFSACSSGSEPEAETETTEEPAENNVADAAENMQDAAKQLSEALQSMTGSGEKVEVVDFRDLKAKLPESLVGMERTEFEGERSGAFGFNVSTASATYRNEDRDQRLEIELIDAGGIGFAQMATSAWAMADIDRETEDGYERTITVDGEKAFEKFDRPSGSYELVVIRKDRYIVNVEGRGLSQEQVKKVHDQLTLEDLPAAPPKEQ